MLGVHLQTGSAQDRQRFFCFVSTPNPVTAVGLMISQANKPCWEKQNIT